MAGELRCSSEYSDTVSLDDGEGVKYMSGEKISGLWGLVRLMLGDKSTNHIAVILAEAAGFGWPDTPGFQEKGCLLFSVSK